MQAQVKERGPLRGAKSQLLHIGTLERKVGTTSDFKPEDSCRPILYFAPGCCPQR